MKSGDLSGFSKAIGSSKVTGDIKASSQSFIRK